MRRAGSVLVLALVGACRAPRPPAPLPPLPHAAYAHYLDGQLAAHRDDWGQAADALADAAAAAPDQPMIAVELARAQHRAKRADAARATLAAAARAWPRHAQVWLASGDVLVAAGTAAARADAARAYRRAIELEPTDERAYLGLARLEAPSAAMATLRRLVARVPTSVEGRYQYGQRLARARDLPGAVRALRAVLERDPDHLDARLDLARILRMQGQLDEAIAQTRSAFDRSGQALDIAEELFWVLCEADDRTAAIDLLTLLDDDRSDADALAIVARFDRGLGRLAEARAVAARIAKLDPDAGAIALAEVELAAGDSAAAAKRLLAIEPRSERFVEARRLAAAALLAAGAPGRALEAIAPARAHPNRVELALTEAMALVDAGRADAGRAVLAALAGRPGATVARARLADHAGDAATALALVEPLARAAIAPPADRPPTSSGERAPADPTAALNLAGYLLAERDERLADAERYLRRARELAPGNPAVLDSWGLLLLRRGQPRAAIRALDQAARYAPREPEILVHLAEAWAADGAPRTAAATLARAATLRPSPAIQRKIDAVRARLGSVPAAGR